MSELSNIVRQRLASRETPVVHPDADTLTAYLEHVLEGQERNQVLEHLARCGQCREVMALSLPEQQVTGEGALVAAVQTSGRRWRFWTPALGLAASLASMAVIAAIIIELPQKSVQEGRQNQGSQPAPAASGNVAPAATSAQPEAAPLADAQPVRPTSREEPRAALAAPKPLAASSLSSVSSPPLEVARSTPPLMSSNSAIIPGGPRQDYLNSQMFANADAYNFNPGVAGASELPSAPPPRSLGDHAQSTLLRNNSPQVTAFADLPPPAQGSKAVRTFTPPSAPPSRFGVPFLVVLGRDTKQLLLRRTSPPITANSFVGHTMGGSQFNPAREKEQSVEVTAAAPLVEKDSAELDQLHAFSARALASPGGARKIEKAAAPQLAWKVNDGKLLKSGDAGDFVEGFSGGEGIAFSVVSFHGPEVWAGGSNAALVHSRDGGGTWERITLGSSATGTISSIEAEGLRVQVKSSSGQSWSSPDGGKTWTLQD